MSVIPRGNINSPIWALQYEPSEADRGHGTLLSSTEGFHFDKMCSEIGLPSPYITCLNENSLITGADHDTRLAALVAAITTHKPVIILGLGARINEIFISETRNYKKPHDCKLDKHAGSLYVSPLLNYPHYMIPLWEPKYIFMDWSYRDIYKFIDLGKAKDCYDYFSIHGSLLPLPNYAIITNPSFHQLADFLNDCRSAEYISTDIETLRPGRSSKLYKGHPGYTYTIAIAPNTKTGCSFSIWNYPKEQLVKIWTELDYVLRHVPQIGQNYIQFDIHHLEALGFSPCINRCKDTRIRHHLLWPEMPHSLQFQCKQYTYQKFYKDDGKTWKPSQLEQLMKYNALDALVTYEIFLRQEEELKERPHLI